MALAVLALASWMLTHGAAPLAQSAAPQVPPGSGARDAASGLGAAQRAALTTRVDELARWVKEQQGQLSLHVVDLETGRELAAVEASRALNPASNMKIVTAAAALDLLGPDYSFRTGIYGELRGSRARSLTLRGDGDPSLTMGDLWRLGAALVARGVSSVEGDLWVDQSRFDAQFVPPAFEQQPNEWAYFRAPVSAVALEANTVTMNVLPTRAGEAARVWFDPPGFIEASGSIRTESSGEPKLTLALTPSGDRLRARLSGTLGERAARQRVVRRVDDPRLFPGYALAHVLRTLGVELQGEVKAGGREVKQELVHVSSRPLAELTTRLGKQSDNFYAEMIFKALAAEEQPGVPSSFEAAAARVTSWLTQKLGQASEGSVILNGSGLFDANRLSARALTGVLGYAEESPRLSAEFMTQLAVGGVDGTLRSRFTQTRAARSVRAKTGTLAKVASLSGYVMRPGRRPIAFSVLISDVSDHAGARQRTDRVVMALAAP
ncbi:MAG: D-alanyl-D-alanine carboxypeptidase/D-alanyl-D-alanine-endopeptidase [Polyangiaceae bacterium]|nr:D-alanyl-D-alanine carboxypeptidase/D-alanyl-D-alanine-endopeptidase [Polyangiaceae bacterium]